MQVRTFIGTLEVIIGGHALESSVLVVANSKDSAWKLLVNIAANSYGASPVSEGEADGGFYFNGGGGSIRPQSLLEIGLATFLELKQKFTVKAAPNVSVPDETLFDSSLQNLAQALTAGLNQKGKVVTHSRVLHAIASAFGENNWHVLKTKLNEVQPSTASTSLIAASTGLTSAHEQWVSAERDKLKSEVAVVEKRGYSIRNNGLSQGWYALLPNQPEFLNAEGDHNYVGFFSTLDDLVQEMMQLPELMPDEMALGLCLADGVAIQHCVHGWFRPGVAQHFATSGDAAREVVQRKNLDVGIRPLGTTVEAVRRAVAEAMFESVDLRGRVEAINGWESNLDDMSRVFFRETDGANTESVTFRVNFKSGSAEPFSWDLSD